MTSKQKWINIVAHLVVALVLAGVTVTFAEKVFYAMHNLNLNPFWIIVYVVTTIASAIWAILMFVITSAVINGEQNTYLGRVIKMGSFAIDPSTGQVVKMFEVDEFHWHWNFSGLQIVSLKPVEIIENSSHLFFNGKMRRISCCIEIAAPVNVEHCQFIKDTIGLELFDLESDVCGPVSSLIFDFCEQCSSELAELYNPEHENQQWRFGKLANNWLSPKLSDYRLYISNATFDMAD